MHGCLSLPRALCCAPGAVWGPCRCCLGDRLPDPDHDEALVASPLWALRRCLHHRRRRRCCCCCCSDLCYTLAAAFGALWASWRCLGGRLPAPDQQTPRAWGPATGRCTVAAAAAAALAGCRCLVAARSCMLAHQHDTRLGCEISVRPSLQPKATVTEFQTCQTAHNNPRHVIPARQHHHEASR